MKSVFPLILILLTAGSADAAQCGYRGVAGNRIRGTMDQCFADNVIDSRARMAIGFEFCYGVNFQILNDTVAIPFNKKVKETTQQIINLSQSMCSDNDDALDQFVFTQSLGLDQNSAGIGNAKDKSTRALKKCVQFFSKVQNSINNLNFDIEYILAQNEELIAPMYPIPDERKKIFTIVLNVVNPLFSCYAPMEELKTELVKKYLRQYLAALVNPPKPSFDDQTYDILSNPEFYSIQGIDTSNLFKGKRSLFEVDLDPSMQQRLEKGTTVRLQLAPAQRLNATERENVLKMDEKAGGLGVAQVPGSQAVTGSEAQIKKAISTGKITRTQVLSMTPKQKLQANIINDAQYRGQVAMEENHLHPGNTDVDELWDPSTKARKNNYAGEDPDRHKLKGFNIDKKIQELFPV